VFNSINVGDRAISLVCALVVVCSVPMVDVYFDYNSAVKPIDLKAIEYINSLDGEYFSCSPEVAPWIYGRYLNKTYKEGEFPYIDRNIPMTSKTNKNTKYYWFADKKEPKYPMQDAVKFAQGGIIINVIP
jgi:hypothetical protein